METCKKNILNEIDQQEKNPSNVSNKNIIFHYMSKQLNDYHNFMCLLGTDQNKALEYVNNVNCDTISKQNKIDTVFNGTTPCIDNSNTTFDTIPNTSNTSNTVGSEPRSYTIGELLNGLDVTHNVGNAHSNNSNVVTNNSANDNSVTDNSVNNSNNVVVNINNFPIIYPHGYENINFLSESDMLNILRNSNDLNYLFQKVFSNMINKNFNKRNMNKGNITYIEKEYEIAVSSEKSFQLSMIDNLITLLKRIFNYCKDKFTIENQIMIWKNIKITEREIKLDSEDIKESISNMILKHNEYKSIRDNFTNFKNKLDSSPEFIGMLGGAIKDTVAQVTSFEKDLNRITFNRKQITIFGDDNNDDEKLDLDNNDNDITLNRLEDTPRYKFFNNVLVKHIEFFKNRSNTIGDIDEYIDLQELQKNKEYETLINKYNPPDDIREELKEKMITNEESVIQYKVKNIKYISANINKS